MGLQMVFFFFFLPTVPRGGTMGLKMDFLSFSFSISTPLKCRYKDGHLWTVCVGGGGGGVTSVL